MGINLGKYSFAGPIASIDNLHDRSGIYAIICKEENEFFLIDVGESPKVRTRIENHDKKDCWTKNCSGQLQIYVHYTPFLEQSGRMLIEKELRGLFDPDCEEDRKIWFSEGLR